MNLKFFKQIACFFCLLLSLTACDRTDNAEFDPLSSVAPIRRTVLSQTTFTPTEKNDLIAHVNMEDDINCPVTARYAAIYELLGGCYQLFNDLRTENVYSVGGQQEQIFHYGFMDVAWTLTEDPRLIFDFDGSIKYYEFGLVENEEVTGIITVYAKREAPRAIAYMFPYVLPYEHVEEDYYVGEYPHRVFHNGIGYRDIEDGEQITYLSLDTAAYWHQIYDQATSDEIAEWETLRQNATTDTQYESEAEIYWDKVDDAMGTASSALDIDHPCVFETKPPKIIENTYIEHLKDFLGETGYCRDYTALPYCDTQLQQTRW